MLQGQVSTGGPADSGRLLCVTALPDQLPAALREPVFGPCRAGPLAVESWPRSIECAGALVILLAVRLTIRAIEVVYIQLIFNDLAGRGLQPPCVLGMVFR